MTKYNMPVLDEFKDRELEVLGLIAKGLSNKEISERLFIAVSTVRWHNRQMYSKLGVHSRTLAVAKARELGLLDKSEAGDVATVPSSTHFVDTTSFVGRAREIVKAKALLNKTRLLTLTGPGGSGKTRLSRKLAQHLEAEYPDGIYFVPLAPVQDAELVGMTIASCLNITGNHDEPITDRLIRELDGKRTLLIIDNFEHVMSAVSLVSMLLKSTSELQIIVTSRQVLHIYGEQEYPVPPLELPDMNAIYSLETFKKVEAIKLFSERALYSNPDFSVTKDNIDDIRKICHYLDGLPLAIELVASYLKMLNPEQIRQRLFDGFDLLSRGPRDAPARQRTLNATIGWSYTLLSEKEKELFAQLSLFDGGFTLDAIEAICTIDEPFDILSSLLDKSLLKYEEKQDDEPRFYMLETIRQFASAKLEDTVTKIRYATLKRRFASYFADFAVYAEPRSYSKKKTYWLKRLKSETGNLLSALRWSVSDEGDLSVAFAIYNISGSLWHLRTHIVEENWTERLLDRVNAVRQSILPAFYVTAARIKRLSGDLDIAISLYQQAIEVGTATEDLYYTACAISNQTMLYGLKGDMNYCDACARFNEALKLFEQLGDDKSIADTVNKMGELARHNGDYHTAYHHYKRASNLSNQNDNWEYYAYKLNLGFVDLKLNRVADARQNFTDALKKQNDIIQPYIMYCLAGFVGVLTAERKLEATACLAGGIDTILAKTRTTLHALERQDYESFMDTLHKYLPEHEFRASYNRGSRMSYDELIAFAQDN